MAINISRQEFGAFKAQGYSRIPVALEVLADLETPLSTFMKLAAGKAYSYLFESVQGGEKWGRYSIIGLPCDTVVQVRGHDIRVETGGQLVEQITAADPLGWIEQYASQFNVPDVPSLPRFVGGLVGYFGYDTIRYIEPRLHTCPNPDPLNTPDILLLVSEEFVVFDNLGAKLHIVVNVDPTTEQAYEQSVIRLHQLSSELRSHVLSQGVADEVTQQVDEEDFISGFTQARYEAAVDKIKDYILAGDAMQVVLSQRLTIPYQAPPLSLYRALRCLNPSPYMFFMDLGEFQIVGSSPEILVRLEDDEVAVRPIAGTRPRGKDEEEDLALEKELLADPKELAEHLMLIDLGRNDAGRVSETGSVKLTEQMIVERYSHVMHIVSNVRGRLKSGMSAMDVLRATFPAGTVSGAPKVRAMEIIDELEPVKRGVYSGAVGYLGWNGNMDTAIAIRTAVIQEKKLHIQAGAGIVADSIPRNEWDETMNKARAIFRAVAMAEEGLGIRTK